MFSWRNKKNTVDSLSRNPRDYLNYFETSTYQICRIEDKINQNNTFHKWICNWLQKLEIYWKYCEKEEKLCLRTNICSFPQYFVTCCKIFMFKQEPEFHFETSGYWRSSKVELTRVVCIMWIPHLNVELCYLFSYNIMYIPWYFLTWQ